MIYSVFPKLRYKSSLRIISIGNLLVGGSGKTPFTIFLARQLQSMGYRVAVSHRGYKGSFENRTTLISNYEKCFPHADEAGDEPQLLAKKLPGVPIVVGRKRKEAIQYLEKNFPDLDFIVLDDSFQHLKVIHDFDFLLFNHVAGIGNGWILPAGALREPLHLVKRADCIVFNGSKNQIPAQLSEMRDDLLTLRFSVDRFYRGGEQDISLDFIKDKRVALLSAIGKPESFEETIKQADIEFTTHYIYPDHFCFSNVDNLKRVIEGKGEIYDFIITTEKDYTKLKNFKDILPLLVMSIECVPTDEEAYARLFGKLRKL